MKKNWKLVKLSDVCEKGSSNVSQNQLNNETGIFPIYGASGFIKNVSFFHQDKPYLSIVKDGSGVGRVTKMTANSSVIGTLQYLIPKEGIDLSYLYYFLLKIDFKKYFTGAAIPHIYFKDYKEEPFLWMPLIEQKQIVQILDKTFAAIDKAKANTEKNLKNAKELFDSYLDSSEHEKVNLGSLVDITTGKLNANAAVENGKYPFFTCSREVYAIDNYSFDLEAILLAGNNASGDFNVKHYKGKFNAYQRTYILTINSEQKILYRYLYFQLLKSLKELKDMSLGANTRFLKLGMIQTLKISLPTILEQQTIVGKLDILRTKTQNLEEICKKKMEDLEELKKSILQKAFTGNLNYLKDELREIKEEATVSN